MWGTEGALGRYQQGLHTTRNSAGLSLRLGVHRASPSPRGTAGSLGRLLYEHWPSPHAAAGSRLRL